MVKISDAKIELDYQNELPMLFECLPKSDRNQAGLKILIMTDIKTTFKDSVQRKCRHTIKKRGTIDIRYSQLSDWKSGTNCSSSGTWAVKEQEKVQHFREKSNTLSF